MQIRFNLLLQEKFIWEIDKIQSLRSPGKGGIEPFQVIHVQFIHPERIVDEDTAPLSALGLVAGDGIGVF
jgi:hypothetical protein